jgi:AraC-like DNA-binding protein
MSSRDHTARSAPALTAELARMTQRLTPLAGDHATAVPSLILHRRNGPTEPLHCIFPLGIAVTTQGRKQVMLGERVFAYGPGESMLTTIDLPVTAHITRASNREPYLGISLAFEALLLARVLSEVESPRRRASAQFEPLSVQRLDEPTLEVLIRLLRLLDEPAMVKHLAPQVQHELLVRLLHGPHATHLAHLAAAGTPRRQVADVVTWLKQHFVEPVAVDALAERANMSPSTFRQHFRAITGMSPVQFQKRLRLQEARQLMLTEGVSAAGASALVGYESASQFNREYRRLFGAPPQRDVRRTQPG